MVSLPSPPTYYSLANTFNVLVVLYYFVVIFNSHVCQSVRFCFSAQFKLSFLPNCKLLKDFAQVSKKKKKKSSCEKVRKNTFCSKRKL